MRPFEACISRTSVHCALCKGVHACPSLERAFRKATEPHPPRAASPARAPPSEGHPQASAPSGPQTARSDRSSALLIFQKAATSLRSSAPRRRTLLTPCSFRNIGRAVSFRERVETCTFLQQPPSRVIAPSARCLLQVPNLTTIYRAVSAYLLLFSLFFNHGKLRGISLSCVSLSGVPSSNLWQRRCKPPPTSISLPLSSPIKRDVGALRSGADQANARRSRSAPPPTADTVRSNHLSLRIGQRSRRQPQGRRQALRRAPRGYAEARAPGALLASKIRFLIKDLRAPRPPRLLQRRPRLHGHQKRRSAALRPLGAVKDAHFRHFLTPLRH